MNTTPCISESDANMASDALVLPVRCARDALRADHPRVRERSRMPLSLKLPEGLSPSYCRLSLPGFILICLASRSACCSTVRPSRSRRSHLPFDRTASARGSARCGEVEPAFAAGALGGPAVLERSRGSWGRAGATSRRPMSSRLLHLAQETLTSSMAYVAPQSGLMHC